MVWGGLVTIWAGLMVVWRWFGGGFTVWGGLGCFNGPLQIF